MQKDTSLVKAINKNVRTSPRKLALVCNFIKGKKVDIALRDLEFSRKRISKDVSKTVKSAISNVSAGTFVPPTTTITSFSLGTFGMQSLQGSPYIVRWTIVASPDLDLERSHDIGFGS